MNTCSCSDTYPPRPAFTIEALNSFTNEGFPACDGILRT